MAIQAGSLPTEETHMAHKADVIGGAIATVIVGAVADQIVNSSSE